MDKDTKNSLIIISFFFLLLATFMIINGKKTDNLVKNYVPVCDEVTKECYLVNVNEYSKAIKE